MANVFTRVILPGKHPAAERRKRRREKQMTPVHGALIDLGFSDPKERAAFEKALSRGR